MLLHAACYELLPSVQLYYTARRVVRPHRREQHTMLYKGGHLLVDYE